MKKQITILLLLFALSTQAQGFGDFDDYDYDQDTEISEDGERRKFCRKHWSFFVAIGIMTTHLKHQ